MYRASSPARPKIFHLDRGTGRAVIAEMAGPRFVKSRPVPLQVSHEDAGPHDVGQAGACRGQDGGQIREDLVRLPAGLGWQPAGLRIVSEQCRHEDPATRFHRLRHWARVAGRGGRLDYFHDICLPVTSLFCVNTSLLGVKPAPSSCRTRIAVRRAHGTLRLPDCRAERK
jgi:hypothetical protein